MLRDKISPLHLCLFHTLDLRALTITLIYISARQKIIWPVNSRNKAFLIPFFTGLHCHISVKKPVEKATASQPLR